jgi:antitoxin component of MazEF toxin-antitoxin module
MKDLCGVMKLEIRVRKIGNSLGILIPGSAVLGTGLCEGDVLEVHVKKGNIIIISNLNVLNCPDLYSNIVEDFFKIAEENKMCTR